MKAIVFKENPGQIGDGYYHMVACFDSKVHVKYTLYCHQENTYLESADEVVKCVVDGRHHGSQETPDKLIVDAYLKFVIKKKAKNKQ